MAYNTIVVKGYPMRKERVAAEAITPGHLIDINSADKVIKHAGAAKTASATFAIENEVFGKGINIAYAADDNVLYGVFNAGDEVYALVAASASAIVIGDELESAGNGTVRKIATDTVTSQDERTSVVGRALQAVDNSAGGSSVRLLIEVV